MVGAFNGVGRLGTSAPFERSIMNSIRFLVLVAILHFSNEAVFAQTPLLDSGAGAVGGRWDQVFWAETLDQVSLQARRVAAVGQRRSARAPRSAVILMLGNVRRAAGPRHPWAPRRVCRTRECAYFLADVLALWVFLPSLLLTPWRRQQGNPRAFLPDLIAGVDTICVRPRFQRDFRSNYLPAAASILHC